MDAMTYRDPSFVEDQEKRLLMIEGLGKHEDSYSQYGRSLDLANYFAHSARKIIARLCPLDLVMPLVIHNPYALRATQVLIYKADLEPLHDHNQDTLDLQHC